MDQEEEKMWVLQGKTDVYPCTVLTGLGGVAGGLNGGTRCTVGAVYYAGYV